ncbi:hypothetical protein D3C76_1211950 [compost metagenome]
MAISDDAEALPEEAIVGRHHHLDPAQVVIIEKQVDDIGSVIRIDRVDDVIKNDERKIVFLSHRQENRQAQRPQMPFAEHSKRIQQGSVHVGDLDPVALRKLFKGQRLYLLMVIVVVIDRSVVLGSLGFDPCNARLFKLQLVVQQVAVERSVFSLKILEQLVEMAVIHRVIEQSRSLPYQRKHPVIGVREPG